MKIDDYIRKEGMTRQEFANKACISKNVLDGIIGSAPCSEQSFQKIHETSNGEIKREDISKWLPRYNPKNAW